MAYNIIVGRDKEDLAKYGDQGLILLGKTYVKMGRTTSLSNPIYVDVAKSHVILLTGKRGSGKCLHGDTLVNLSDGSQMPIKDLENNSENILSLSEKLKIEKTQKTEFFSREVDELIKVKLRSGKEIKLTKEHPLLTIKGWKETQELTIGSRIATPRKTNNFGNKNLSDHEIKLLAYLIAEGHTKKIVLFSNNDDKIVEEFRNDMKKLDPTSKLTKEKEGHYRISNPSYKTICLDTSKMVFDKKRHCWAKGSKIINQKRKVRIFLEKYKIYDLSALQKFIPEQIMRLRKEKISLFLNRLFSCDGSIYFNNSRSGWEISYASSSKKLIKQVHHLLLRYGILSRLRNKKVKLNNKIFKSYEIVVNVENSIKFINEIGFFGEKEKKVEKFKEDTKKISFNSNVDTIPKEIWDLYRPNNWAEVGRFCGYKHPKAMRERIHYSTTRQVLSQISKAEQHNGLKLLAESDVFWDEIMSIEKLEGKFKVYDLCVPENHNFVANDIIVHNSYSMSVMAESMANLPEDVRKNLSIVILDTMGIFWSMKFPNEKDADLLKEWNLEPTALEDINIFTPAGYFNKHKQQGIPVDFPFTIKPNLLSSSDWANTFNLEVNSQPSVLITRILKKLRGNYSIHDIIMEIESDKKSTEETRNLVESLFESSLSWGLFSEEAEEFKNLTQPGKISIIDISCYSSIAGSWSIKGLVTGLISQKILQERMLERKKEEIKEIKQGFSPFKKSSKSSKLPQVWMLIDEAHEMLPKNETTPATAALISLLREGRQPGISLVLATQQPGKIHNDVITQSDIVLSHRLTAKQDIDALNKMMQSYVNLGITEQINDLPREKGAGILLDDTSERIYPLRVRPKLSWHAGSSPSIVPEIKKELEL